MLVVARYEEDISWVSKYSDNMIIYNKGSTNSIPSDKVYDLPNVGREAHTFLWHIVNNYDHLDDLLVFVQGKCDDHLGKDWTVDDLMNLPEDEEYSKNLVDSSLWGDYASSYDFRIYKWNHTNLAPTKQNESYGQWYERLFKQEFPHRSTKVYAGAIFSVRRSAIHRYPKELYEQLLEEVSHDNAPEAAHFMERTWSKMFCGPWPSPAPKPYH